MDLMLEEALVEVLPESIIEGRFGLLPRHREGEVKLSASLQNGGVL